MVKIFDQYLAKLNKQWVEDDTLTNDQVKALEERAYFIVNSFKYQGRLSAKSAELRFYIIKLTEATGFDSKCLHKVIYQEQS